MNRLMLEETWDCQKLYGIKKACTFTGNKSFYVHENNNEKGKYKDPEEKYLDFQFAFFNRLLRITFDWHKVCHFARSFVQQLVFFLLSWNFTSSIKKINTKCCSYTRSMVSSAVSRKIWMDAFCCKMKPRCSLLRISSYRLVIKIYAGSSNTNISICTFLTIYLDKNVKQVWWR